MYRLFYAELVQGEYEVLLDIPFVDPEEVFTTNNIYEDARLVLKKHKVWIKDNRYSAIPREETSIHNVIDGAVALYQRLNYKLFDLKQSTQYTEVSLNSSFEILGCYIKII